MPRALDYEVEARLIASEVRNRRTLCRVCLVLAATAFAVAAALLIEGSGSGVSADVRFTIAAAAAATLVAYGGVLWRQSEQLSHLEGFDRLFLVPYTRASGLAALRVHPSLRPPGPLLREPYLHAVALGAGATALALVWHDRGPAGSLRNDVVYGLAVVALLQALVVAFEAARDWGSPVHDLAKALDALRKGSARYRFVDSTLSLKRDRGKLLVQQTAGMPPAELIAAAYFAPSGARAAGDASDGWQAYVADPQTAATQRDIASDDNDTPLAVRAGPLLAATMVGVGVVVLTVSFLGDHPAALPGWSMGSPAIYEAARGGLVLLVLFVLCNLLVLLASGRVLSKVSQSGLEFGGVAADELASASKKTSTAVETLTQNQADLEKALESSVAELNDQVVELAEHIASIKP